MNNIYVRNIIRFVLLILLQVLVLDTVQFGGFVIPYVYLLFVLLLPANMNKSLVLLLAFAAGFSVDFFENTLGLQTAAIVFMAFARPGVIKFYFSGTEFSPNEEPGPARIGLGGFLKYSFTLVLIHQFALTFLELFSFRHFLNSLFDIVVNALATTLAIFIVVLFFTPLKRRRRMV